MAKFYLNNHNIESIVTFLYDFHLSKIEEMRVFLHIFELQCCIFGQNTFGQRRDGVPGCAYNDNQA